jgi:hypothetical protein
LDEYPEAHRLIVVDILTAMGSVSLMLTSRPNIAPESFPAASVLKICAKEEDIRRYVETQT